MDSKCRKINFPSTLKLSNFFILGALITNEGVFKVIRKATIIDQPTSPFYTYFKMRLCDILISITYKDDFVPIKQFHVHRSLR